jgi:presenilin-like A22 family membrane protease
MFPMILTISSDYFPTSTNRLVFRKGKDCVLGMVGTQVLNVMSMNKTPAAKATKLS